MAEVAMKLIHKELVALRQDIRELKECFHEDFLEVAPEVIKAVKESRKRMKKTFVSHEDMRKEFG